MEQDGRRVGRMWRRLKDDVERPLTAILTLNTIAHTVGAIGVGSVVQAEYGSTGLAIASALLTAAVLLFSEILPKTLGATFWRPLAIPSGYLLRWMIAAMWVVVVPIEWLRKMLPRPKEEAAVTREELAILAEISGEEGSIESDERNIIRNLLTLSQRTVGEVMTPRTVLSTVNISDTVQDVMDRNGMMPHSRMPVYGDSLDDRVGIVLRRSILREASEDHFETKMSDLMQPIETCADSDDLDQVLDVMIAGRHHLLAVDDGFGGTAGIITLEDILETLLGVEIVDESDPVIDMRVLAEERAATDSAP